MFNQFFYNLKTETLTIQYEDGSRKEGVKPNNRDKFGGPFFNVGETNVSHGIQFSERIADKGMPTHREVVKAFYKHSEQDQENNRLIETYYRKEQDKVKEQDIYHFTFDFRDIVERGADAKGKYKNR